MGAAAQPPENAAARFIRVVNRYDVRKASQTRPPYHAAHRIRHGQVRVNNVVLPALNLPPQFCQRPHARCSGFSSKEANGNPGSGKLVEPMGFMEAAASAVGTQQIDFVAMPGQCARKCGHQRHGAAAIEVVTYLRDSHAVRLCLRSNPLHCDDQRAANSDTCSCAALNSILRCWSPYREIGLKAVPRFQRALARE